MHFSKLLFTALALLATCAAASDYGQLLDRLRIDHAAMVAAEQDYHRQRQRGSLGTTETADYAAYIARLHRRVAEDCVALGNAGLPLPPDLGCPELPPLALAPAAIDQAAEQTLDEQIAALDAELYAGLGEFDEMLLREQQRVRAATPMPDAAGGGAGGPGAGTEGGSAEGTGQAGGDAAESGIAATPGAGPEHETGGRTSHGVGAGPGTQRQGGGPDTPPDIPDASTDDVVARQLREAAEKETDPELKKKLWEEYRKYKAGTR
jgi:hypothetical protein